MIRLDVSREDTHQSLSQDIVNAAKNLKPGQQYWVAIVGAPASGKSTLAARVRRLINDQGIPCAAIGMDGYHYYKKELDAMPDPEALHLRRGAHWTFNAEKFVAQMKEARRTGTGSFPSFDHHEGDPTEDQMEGTITSGPSFLITIPTTHTQLSTSTKVVIVEGNYLLLNIPPWNQLLEGVFDLKVFIACDQAIRRARVIARHVSTGNDIDLATKRADANDVPNGLLIDQESMPLADQVIHSKEEDR